MLLLPFHRRVCQQCMMMQLTTYTLPVTTTTTIRHLSITHHLLTDRKSLSKEVKSDRSSGFGQKAKEATRTTYYTAVVVGGLGVTGLMLYAVFKELLSSFSPQTVYSAAVKKCCAHPRVADYLGESVKSYGEESRRGRRQHISHVSYEVEGSKGMRMKFYLKGQRRTATAHLDARQTSSGWEFRYLFVQLDSYPHEVIVVEDNRGTAFESSPSSPSANLSGGLSSDNVMQGSDIPALTPLFPPK